MVGLSSVVQTKKIFFFGNENKKVVGDFKIETPKSIWKDRFLCLRGKAYPFKFGSENKSKLNSFTKS